MTAVLERGPRALRGKIRDDLATAVRALAKPHALLLSGKPVRFRAGQSLFWALVVGLLGAAFISGLYDGGLQVNWYIHIGPVHAELFYLKPSWDSSGFGLVHSGNWPLYRHLAFRDIAAPAIGTMAVGTLLAKPKWWDAEPVGTVRLVTAPLVILAATFALGVGGVYLAYFGLPDAWHHLFGSYVLPGTKWLGTVSAAQLLLGFTIGRVLRRYWAPIGATLQGFQMDKSVDRWQTRVISKGITVDDAARERLTPRWVRLPIVPPVLRERFSLLWRSNKTLRQVKTGKAAVIITVTVIIALITALGIAGHYWAGAGHAVPYLFPNA